jgi:hypothetical protein
MTLGYGATPQEWEAFAALNLRDLLPTICDPDVRMSERSDIRTPLSKTPSTVNEEGLGHGFKVWPTRITKPHEIIKWSANNKLGIGFVARNLRAIDIDVTDLEEAKQVEAFIRSELGVAGLSLPVRTRPNSGKRLLMYRLADAPTEGLKVNRIVVNEGGQRVEFLHDSQYFIVAGMHPSLVRYEWLDGLPRALSDIPVIECTDLQALYRAMDDYYGDTQATVLTHKRALTSRRASQVDAINDPIIQYLYQYDWVLSEAADGGYNVLCPWKPEHGPQDNETQAKFFPQGLGGFLDHPGFKCLHAHCDGRTHQAFLSKIGFYDTDFEEVPDAPDVTPTRPKFTYKGRSQVIESTLSNMTAMASWPEGFGYDIRYDRFKDATLFKCNGSGWKPLTDDTYTEMRLRMVKAGFESTVPKETVRDVISFVAQQRTMDSAQEWLNAQRWDGVPRLASFHQTVLGIADTPYHRAVCAYMWTALAGRVLSPGCKADMVPILIGAQGQRKSTLAEVLAPTLDEYTSVTLADRDDNLSRVLRGKLIAEWGELRGLETRDSEAIKDWVSRRKDDWIPKFKEFGTTLPRRFLLIGTTNNHHVLNDPTGARRYLPMFIPGQINTDYVQQHHEALWGEARELFKANGVLWQDAEALARPAQKQAAVQDLWIHPVVQWLESQAWREDWMTHQILQGACGIGASSCTRAHQERMRRVMAFLGWEQNQAGRWHSGLA